MKKTRIILAIALCVIITIGVAPQGFATEKKLDSSKIVKLDTYNNIMLSWEKTNSLKTISDDRSYINLYEVLKEIKVDNKTYIYNYNDSNNRISKISNNNILVQYEYEDNRLIKEIYDDYTIEYFYNEIYEVSGFIYDGSKYYYVKDNNNNIVSIKNSMDKIIYEYNYDVEGKVINLFELNNISEDKNTLIGNINKFRYNSYYYDDETGYYYNGILYYDTNYERLSAREKDNKIPDYDYIIEKYSFNTKSLNDVDLAVQNWHSELMNDPDYGEDLRNSGNNPWYNGLISVDITARVMYGENTSNIYEQTCIMWVLYNRLNNRSNLYTYYDVVTQNLQFAALFSDNAKNPTNYTTFSNATYLSCLIHSTNSQSYISTIDFRPTWMTSSYEFFKSLKVVCDANRLREYNNQLQLLTDGVWTDINNVYIIQNHSTSYLLDSMSDVNNVSNKSYYNFFHTF